MSDIKNLMQRVHNEFAASQEKLKQFQNAQVETYHARTQRKGTTYYFISDETAAVFDKQPA